MADAKSNFMPEEQVLLKTQMHWIVFVWPAFITLCLVYFIVAQRIMPLLNFVALVLIIYLLGRAFIQYLTTSYTLTSSRAIVKKGVFFIHSSDMSLKRVESVQLQQSIIGRMLGFGNIIINGTGGDHNVFVRIENPTVFREKIFAAMDAIRHE